MKKWLIIITMLLTSYVNAANIQLSPYYQANCADYAGTWQGFMTNPSDLFAGGGPWPVKLTLTEKQGQLYGRTIVANNPVLQSLNNREVFVRCENGNLQKIFWGKKGSCGTVSQQGVQVSKNVIVLQLMYENAMMNAPFLLFLKRTGGTPAAKPIPVLDFDQVQTCH